MAGSMSSDTRLRLTSSGGPISAVAALVLELGFTVSGLTPEPMATVSVGVKRDLAWAEAGVDRVTTEAPTWHTEGQISTRTPPSKGLQDM